MSNQNISLPVHFVTGDTSGLQIPAHADALRQAGPDFLTAAFRQFGALAADNHVRAIAHCETFGGGNSGHKVMLSIDYAHDAPDLHRELFVKFSRDFSDPFRDRRRQELEAEVRLATLSRLPAFPVTVPKAYFADFNQASGTGLVIAERIAFGTGRIEPLHAKCMDERLDDPLAYYKVTVAALARLAAAHQSGRLSPQVDMLFPFDAAKAAADIPIPWTESQLRERVARYAEFAGRCPQLLPPYLKTPQFIACLERDAVRFLQHEVQVKRFLHGNPDFISLCHWNTNLDNAWFWRDEHAQLHCGLLDWGMVRQMNVGYALWGGICGANFTLWDQHQDELLQHFIAELRTHGGSNLDLAELRLHVHLSAAMLGLGLMMDAPALVLSRLPEAVDARDTRDPIMHRNEIARTFLHVFTAFLHLWSTQDFGASLDRILARR